MNKPRTAVVFGMAALFTYAVMTHAESGDVSAGAGSHDQQADQSQTSDAGTGDFGSAMPAGALEQQTWDEQMQRSFIEHAISGNQFEIESAQLAQEKSQNQQVKQFAQTLQQQHQQAQDGIQQAAQAVGVSDMEKLGPVQQAELDMLRELDGAQFDMAYIYTQVGCHNEEVLKYRDASQNAQDPQVRAYASQTLPVLQRHLEQAERIAGADEARTASDIMQPSGDAGAGLHDGSGADLNGGTDAGSIGGADSGSTGGSGMGTGVDAGGSSDMGSGASPAGSGGGSGSGATDQ